MGRTIRRVVTGHDANGKATVIMDGPAGCILSRPNRPGVTLTNLWQADRTAAPMERHDDPVDG
ncbi:MAG: cupin domain-containing protein, partial [Alphaproteobacteria bacterium]